MAVITIEEKCNSNRPQHFQLHPIPNKYYIPEQDHDFPNVTLLLTGNIINYTYMYTYMLMRGYTTDYLQGS